MHRRGHSAAYWEEVPEAADGDPTEDIRQFGMHDSHDPNYARRRDARREEASTRHTPQALCAVHAHARARDAIELRKIDPDTEQSPRAEGGRGMTEIFATKLAKPYGSEEPGGVLRRSVNCVEPHSHGLRTSGPTPRPSASNRHEVLQFAQTNVLKGTNLKFRIPSAGRLKGASASGTLLRLDLRSSRSLSCLAFAGLSVFLSI
jgi:hypothetical protein